MPLPFTVLRVKSRWFYLSGTGSPGRPGQRAVKCVCVCVYIYISKSLCLCVVVKCWSTATWLSIRPARPNTLSLPAYLVLSQRGSVDVGWSDISLWLRNSPAEKRVRHFRPGQWLGTNTDAVFLLLCPSPRRAAALGYRHAGCLQLSHMRTVDPSADGRRSAASWTAIGGDISSHRSWGDNLLLLNSLAVWIQCWALLLCQTSTPVAAWFFTAWAWATSAWYVLPCNVK